MASRQQRSLAVAVLFLLGAALLDTALGHGQLSVPTPRRYADNCEYDLSIIKAGMQPCMEDGDMPVNMDDEHMPKDQYGSRRFPLNNQAKHPWKQSMVCRIPNGLSVTPSIKLEAGKTLFVKWTQTAAHPGDGGIYVSYDADYPAAKTEQMRFFKIANIPQQRLLNKLGITINLPSWLPPGKAVLKWSWYGTHNAPWVEFFANCVDVEVVSSSAVKPSDIPSYPIESGTARATSYPPYYDEKGEHWCYDCTAADWMAKKIAGPPCVGGVEGNCCDLSTYTAANFNAKECHRYSGAARTACRKRAGFDVCQSHGNSGPAPWLAATQKPAATKQPTTKAPAATPNPSAPTNVAPGTDNAAFNVAAECSKAEYTRAPTPDDYGLTFCTKLSADKTAYTLLMSIKEGTSFGAVGLNHNAKMSGTVFMALEMLDDGTPRMSYQKNVAFAPKMEAAQPTDAECFSDGTKEMACRWTRKVDATHWTPTDTSAMFTVVAVRKGDEFGRVEYHGNSKVVLPGVNYARETATPTPSATAYRMLTAGNCADAGLSAVASSADCAKAASFLALSTTVVRTTAASPRPEGCYAVTSSGSLWFSTLSDNAGNGASESRSQICKGGAASTAPPTKATTAMPFPPTTKAPTDSCAAELAAQEARAEELQRELAALTDKLRASNACSFRGRRPQ